MCVCVHVQAAAKLLADEDNIQSRFVKYVVSAVLRNMAVRVLVHGPGGCGKSHVARAVTHLLRTGRRGVVVGAPTGCAAFQLGGATLHSLLALPVVNDSYGRAAD